MNQYRYIVVECCGKCIHSAYRSPTERFCNREKPYWTLRLDQWADGISSCCTLPTHTDFQSGWDTVLDELLNWKPGYKQYRGNWIVKVDDLYTKIEELRQAGKP